MWITGERHEESVELTPTASLPLLTVAFGGGGPFGIAYGLGVVDGLAAGGVSFADVDFLGTSAGAWVAACLATDVTFAELCRVPQIRIPNIRPGLLRGIATDMFGTSRSSRVTGSTLRLPTLRRALLSGATYPLADIVAASSAIPGVFPPVRVRGSWYIDGGVRSLVSADRAIPAEHLLVVAPIAGPMFGPAGVAMERMLQQELLGWQRSTGGQTHLIRPNHQIAGLARQPLDLFDKARALDVYPLAYEQARLLAEVRPLPTRQAAERSVATRPRKASRDTSTATRRHRSATRAPAAPQETDTRWPTAVATAT